MRDKSTFVGYSKFSSSDVDVRMNRQELLTRINTFIGRFTQEVKQYNAANQYDINIHAESVLIPLLREIFDYEGLQNANAAIKNAPAIDLIDYQSRVCIQVTASADAQKITDTLTKFTKNAQQRAFDRLMVYIITERQDNYRKDFNTLLPQGFDFETDRDVIDNAILYRYISTQVLNTHKLAKIEKLLADEFSELKIQQRSVKSTFENQSGGKADRIYPNLLELAIPNQLFQADLNFDFDKNKSSLVQYLKSTQQYKKIKHISGRDIINHYLGNYNKGYAFDFILRSGKIFTFRDLYAATEPLRKVIDAGTIVPLSLDEYIGDNEDRLSNIKDLLNSTMKHDFSKRDIEWVEEEKVYRFQIGKALNGRKVSYKTKDGRGVVFEVLSKENHKNIKDENGNVRSEKGKYIVCFRHLAFRLIFEKFGEKWYVSLKPDWSFTSALDGKRPSRYAAFYLSGIKKLEWNDTIYDYFQFLSDYLSSLSQGDMFTGFVIKLSKLKDLFEMSPAIPDEVWKQSEPKHKTDKTQYDLFGS